MLLAADLPDDPDALRAMIVAAHREIAKREVTLAEHEERIAGLETAGARAEAEIARLNAIIAAFQRHRFGARSEQLDEDQLQLAFEELDAALSGVMASLDAVKKDSGTPAPRKSNRDRCPRISNGSNKSSISRIKPARAAAVISTSSVKMLPSGSMSCLPRSACSSPGVRAMAAARARPRRSRPRHPRGSSTPGCRPKR